MHIFISYAKVDTRLLALKIRDRLTALPGVTAWMDESLEAASSWASQIQEEIDRCDYVVVLLSPDVNRPATPNQARSFVLNEIDYAQQLHKTIVPVMGAYTRVPVQLAGIQYIDLSRDEDTGIGMLIRHLTGEREAVGPHTPPMPGRQSTQRSIPYIWVAAGVLVVIAIIAGLLIIRPPFGPFGVQPTPNFQTQAAILLTERAVGQIPTLNATEIIATNIANLLATENAKVATPTPLPTDTPIPSDTPTPTQDFPAMRTATAIIERATQQAIENTAQAFTQVAQATEQFTTNTPLPTSTATSTVPPTLTATVTSTTTPTPTPNVTLTVQALVAQSTAIYDAALATATAQAQESDRVREAAFNITSAFDGSTYSTVQNFDAGIVSYGRFGFTLAAGSLTTVLEDYVSNSDSDTATELAGYMNQVRNRDPMLRDDMTFRDLLIEAGNDPVMQAAQDKLATESYWNLVQEGSIVPRGIQTPLGQAFLFDMAIQFGPNHGFIRLAEQNLGVEDRSRVGDNGITEEELITEIARLRKESHDRQAERDNLPNLSLRGDFWVNLIEQGDWQLQGDENGNVEVLPDRFVQVRNP